MLNYRLLNSPIELDISTSTLYLFNVFDSVNRAKDDASKKVLAFVQSNCVCQKNMFENLKWK